MRATIEKITAVSYFPVPKVRYPKGVPQSLREGAVETPIYWELPCSHILNSGAGQDEITSLRRTTAIPEQIATLLAICNGGDLFRLHYHPQGQQDSWLGRYRLLTATDLRQVNQQMLKTFRSYAQNDLEVRHIRELNYLAFCDIGDGDFLAVTRAGADSTTVFYLDHEYGFYPFGGRGTGHAYEAVADSIDSWLDLLLQTRGAGGIGNRHIPL